MDTYTEKYPTSVADLNQVRFRIVLPDLVFVIHPNSPDPPLKLPIPHLHQLILK